jgi:hypothetical protein
MQDLTFGFLINADSLCRPVEIPLAEFFEGDFIRAMFIARAELK